jgi:hypothetical protein
MYSAYRGEWDVKQNVPMMKGGIGTETEQRIFADNVLEPSLDSQ